VQPAWSSCMVTLMKTCSTSPVWVSGYRSQHLPSASVVMSVLMPWPVLHAEGPPAGLWECLVIGI